jgi:hypothetical protein
MKNLDRKECNGRIFEIKARDLDQLTGALVNELFVWPRIWGSIAATIVTDFVDSLDSLSSTSSSL